MTARTSARRSHPPRTRGSYGERTHDPSANRHSVAVRRVTPALVALAVAIAGVGLTQALFRIQTAGADPRDSASWVNLDGLLTQVTGAQWLSHEHEDASGYAGAAAGSPVTSAQPSTTTGQPSQPGIGYQMPASMMPGMPADGESRLVVRLTLANDEDTDRHFDLATDFSLKDAKGHTYKAKGDTFGAATRLTRDNSVDAAVYFDVPSAGEKLHQWFLEWHSEGQAERIPIPPAMFEVARQHH